MTQNVATGWSATPFVPDTTSLAEASQKCRGCPPFEPATPTVVTYCPSAGLRADERAAEVRLVRVDDLLLAREWTP